MTKSEEADLRRNGIDPNGLIARMVYKEYKAQKGMSHAEALQATLKAVKELRTNPVSGARDAEHGEDLKQGLMGAAGTLAELRYRVLLDPSDEEAFADFPGLEEARMFRGTLVNLGRTDAVIIDLHADQQVD